MIYKKEKININISGMPFELWRVTNIDEIFDALIQKGNQHEDVKDERIPYWAELWASALGLSQALIENNWIRNDMTVTELGCGLGLPSIVAGKLGAKVILTDYLPEALDFAEQNWILNLPNTHAQFEIMDWRSPRPELAADLVLASDVAYEKRTFEHLLPAFHAICRPGGRVILSEPNRIMAKPFLQQLHNQGYISTKMTLEIVLRGLHQNVNVFCIEFSS